MQFVFAVLMVLLASPVAAATVDVGFDEATGQDDLQKTVVTLTLDGATVEAKDVMAADPNGGASQVVTFTGVILQPNTTHTLEACGYSEDLAGNASAPVCDRVRVKGPDTIPPGGPTNITITVTISVE